MQEFYVGFGNLGRASRFNYCMISATTLEGRVDKPFSINNWMMDSGAFTQIQNHGDFRMSVRQYANMIKKWSHNGNLVCASTQDYMCEPSMLEITGMTVRQHQVLTISRYRELLDVMDEIECDVPILPVLQGWEPYDYIEHLNMYEECWRGLEGMSAYAHRYGGKEFVRPERVGIGTMCKRNGSPAQVEFILRMLQPRMKDYKIHAFGLKTTALKWGSIRDMIHSSDSMAWDYHARINGHPRKAVDRERYALEFEEKIANQTVQEMMIYE